MIIPNEAELAFLFKEAFHRIVDKIADGDSTKKWTYLELGRATASSHRVVLDPQIPSEPGEPRILGTLSYFTGRLHEQRRQALVSLSDGKVLERNKDCSLISLLATFYVATRIARAKYTYVITEEAAQNVFDREAIGIWKLSADSPIDWERF